MPLEPLPGEIEKPYRRCRELGIPFEYLEANLIKRDLLSTEERREDALLLARLKREEEN